MTTPAEPDWNKLIDMILEYMADEDRDEAEDPVGLDHYYFSEHTRNLNRLDVFHWPDDWIKIDAQPKSILLMWLEHEYKEWWEEQAWEFDGWRGWLEGFEIRVGGRGYIDDLNKKLLKLYRERITETHPCSICGKEASEKHPYGHPDHLIRLGQPDPDVYPDGKPPKGMPTDDIQYKKKLYCEECWRRDILKEKK